MTPVFIRRPWRFAAGGGDALVSAPGPDPWVFDLGPFDDALVQLPGDAPTALPTLPGRKPWPAARGAPAGRMLTPPRPKAPAEGALLTPAGPVLRWPGAPARRSLRADPTTPAEIASAAAMTRALRVANRVQDVEEALDDPATFWKTLSDLWRDAELGKPPDRDVIVRQAREMPAILDHLAGAPRKVLRRDRDSIPIGRVQEVDRAAMLWLTRQPGRTAAERAGPSQRMRAPVRRESYDTLENRVLRSYAELAAQRAADYRRRNNRPDTARQSSVAKFERRCRAIARTLGDMQVRRATPGLVPNYVLLHDRHYRAVWKAWEALLRRSHEEDEIWFWQARAWDEFCALAVAVALTRHPGAEIIAAAPIGFQEDLQQGMRLRHDNPLLVVHLTHEDLIAEVQFNDGKASLGRLGAPLWLRIGDFSGDIQRRAPIWPIHGFGGDADPNDAAEIAGLLTGFPTSDSIRAGMVLRPTDGVAQKFEAQSGRVRAMSATIAPAGGAMTRGLAAISQFCADLMNEARR